MHGMDNQKSCGTLLRHSGDNAETEGQQLYLGVALVVT